MTTTILLPCLTIVAGIVTNYAEGTGYQLMDEFDFSLEETDHLLFEVRTCASVHLLLIENKNNFETGVYEIKIGKWNTSDSTIDKVSSGIPLPYSEQQPLECDSERAFWITWNGSTIHVGTGFAVGEEEFMTYSDASPVVVNHVSVTPGYWVFYSSTCKCCNPKPRNCQGLQESGITDSGIYSLTSIVRGETVDIYCDMETDGGGWLVFQRRSDGSENFYRGWVDYENGFGALSGEFWLGNRYLSTILSEGHYELRIDLEDWEGNRRYANYQTFLVGNSLNNYKLTVCGYSGDAGDSMAFQNGMDFTTKDRDNDIAYPNCAEFYKGAWWYSKCHRSNLNGQYLRGNHSSVADGVNWDSWKGYHYSLKISEMKIREICKM